MKLHIMRTSVQYNSILPSGPYLQDLWNLRTNIMEDGLPSYPVIQISWKQGEWRRQSKVQILPTLPKQEKL